MSPGSTQTCFRHDNSSAKEVVAHLFSIWLSVVKFQSMASTDRLRKGLEKFFGLKEFRAGQLEIINSVMNGFDTLAVMPTGGGKSVCYQLPALLSDGLTIVVTPLISLMKDQVAQINRKEIVATQLDSTLELDEIRDRLQLVASQRVKLLYVAPERLESARFINAISKTRVSILAVDEAHCISQWGHDFRPHYTRISEFSAAIGTPTLLALTATATPDVQDDIVAQLKMRSPRVYVSGFARENLSLQVIVETSKTHSVLKYIENHEGPGIVYAATRKSVDEIHGLLKSKGMNALRYHAGLTGVERTNSQVEFLKNDRVMVATNSFGMGINKADVRYVIHYEVPGTLEAYYQEAGRAGRDGKLAECVLLFNKRDLMVQEYFIRTLYPEKDAFIKAYSAIFDSLSIPVGTTAKEYQSVSSQKIVELTKLDARTVDSVFRILSQNGIIQLIPSISAKAYVRSTVDVVAYRRAMDRTSSNDTRSVLDTLLRLYGTSIFTDARPVTIEDIAHKSGLSASTVNRTLSILQRSGVLEYKPPAEGISFRMLTSREDPERLPIDFGQIALLANRAQDRLRAIVDYAKTTTCRTNFILSYFGTEEIQKGCGNCDNCTVSQAYLQEVSKDASIPSVHEIHRTILSLVDATGGRYGRTTYCKILLKEDSKKDLSDKLRQEFDGKLKDLPPQAVYFAFDFLLSRKYLSKANLLYSTVSITEEGKDYLKSGFSKPVHKPYSFRKPLYKALRDERRTIAVDLQIPVFGVCSDSSLVRMANEHPVSRNEIAKYLADKGIHTDKITDGLLQVCLDFKPLDEGNLSDAELKVYELFVEGLTAAEISEVLGTSAQNVIEILESLRSRNFDIDLRRLIKKDVFALIEKKLKETGDVVSAHRAVQDCELAEVMLVSTLIGTSA